jgi:hypothetical protein
VPEPEPATPLRSASVPALLPNRWKVEQSIGALTLSRLKSDYEALIHVAVATIRFASIIDYPSFRLDH